MTRTTQLVHAAAYFTGRGIGLALDAVLGRRDTPLGYVPITQR